MFLYTSSDEDDRSLNQLPQALSHFLPPPTNVFSSMAIREPLSSKIPYQYPFVSRDDEMQYINKLMANCTMFNGDPERLITWLNETGAFIAKEGSSDPEHLYIFRRLLTADALNYYMAHDDLIFNFSDLCKLFLHSPSILAQISWSSHILQTFPVSTSSNSIESHYRNSDWPAGTETWSSSSPLPPRQSHFINSSHHFHPQHERDYLLAKSISLSSSSRRPMSPSSYDTLQCTEVESIWLAGYTSWFSDSLPPRSQSVSMDDAASVAPKTLSSSSPEHETKIMFPSATCMVFSQISQIARFARVSVLSCRRHLINAFSSSEYSYLSSLLSFFSYQQHSLQLLGSAILSALFSLFVLVLISVRFNFNNDRGASAPALYPVRQLWHVMVP